MAEEASVSHKIDIGEQSFRIRVHPDEREFYDRVAAFTDRTFREIRDEGMTASSGAWAMAAFQIACDLFDTRANGAPSTPESQARIDRLIRRIEEVTSNAS